MRSSLSIDADFSTFSTAAGLARPGRARRPTIPAAPAGLAPEAGLSVAEDDDDDLTPINLGSVQRSVILPSLLGGLIFTRGSAPERESFGPNEAGALDVCDGLGAGPVDGGTIGLGDELATFVPGAGTRDTSSGLPSSNLALRGFFTLSFVGYSQHPRGRQR